MTTKDWLSRTHSSTLNQTLRDFRALYSRRSTFLNTIFWGDKGSKFVEYSVWYVRSLSKTDPSWWWPWHLNNRTSTQYHGWPDWLTKRLTVHPLVPRKAYNVVLMKLLNHNHYTFWIQVTTQSYLGWLAGLNKSAKKAYVLCSKKADCRSRKGNEKRGRRERRLLFVTDIVRIRWMSYGESAKVSLTYLNEKNTYNLSHTHLHLL